MRFEVKGVFKLIKEGDINAVAGGYYTDSPVHKGPFRESWKAYTLEKQTRWGREPNRTSCDFCGNMEIADSDVVYGMSPNYPELKVIMFSGNMCERCQRKQGLLW